MINAIQAGMIKNTSSAGVFNIVDGHKVNIKECDLKSEWQQCQCSNSVYKLEILQDREE
jgi:hypothetical protein